MGALIGARLVVAVGEGEMLAEFVVAISRGETLALALLLMDGKDVVVVGTLAAAAAAAAAAAVLTAAGVIGCPCRCSGEPSGAAMSATAATPPGVTDPPIVTGTGGRVVVGGTAGDPYGGMGPRKR